MEQGQPSWTAIASAMWRAGHLLIDDDPKILRDDFALPLAGFQSADALQAALAGIQAEAAQQPGFDPATARFVPSSLRAIMSVRNRYAEDELEEAIHRGMVQYVLLGAGLDSFAYRRPDLAPALRVFELDYPSTQQWKRSRLQELDIPIPGNLAFVPIDFQTQTLRETLVHAGYQADAPGFFSWLGVTQYLTPGATMETLHQIAGLAPGSDIVFEYTMPEGDLDGDERKYLARVKETSAARGEPWLGFFDPAELHSLLNAAGFVDVMDMDAEAINRRYFADRADGLRSPAATHLVRAAVGSAS